MPKISKGMRKKREKTLDPKDFRKFEEWLKGRSPVWSLIIASRAALRVLPLLAGTKDVSEAMLPIFRAVSIARYASIYSTYQIQWDLIRSAAAGVRAFHLSRPEAHAIAYAIDAVNLDASNAAHAAAFAADADVGARGEIGSDAQSLSAGSFRAEQLARAPLWSISDNRPPLRIREAWRRLSEELQTEDSHWSVWIDWYNCVLEGTVHSQAWDATFADVYDKLPWGSVAKVVNAQIARYLLDPDLADPFPIEGIPSPIAIGRRSDGRIGVDAGEFEKPTIPPTLTSDDHNHTLLACRSRAQQLCHAASLANFQGRREYGEALASYLDWLPTETSGGNILLADGEARVLTKLFTADEAILSAGFATRLSVLLEDHIALRAFYPEVERHYHSVRTGRIAAPLPRDVVEAIRQVIHENTPNVFDESVAAAIDEVAKPIPNVAPLSPSDIPTLEPGQPKPPKDPIAGVDPAKSRSFTFASASNRIWAVLMSGKDLPQAIDGWQKTYNQFKPHIGTVIEWLRHFSGGGDGTPPMPPTVSV